MIIIKEGGKAMKCPKCGSEDVKTFTISNTLYCKCEKCGNAWKINL
jgi:DNA-directed RNA polymerase subunit M/transcription elongation factor TFIIS